MPLSGPTIKDWPPSINCNGLPKAERDAASHLFGLFSSLMSYGDDFRSALALFDHCQSEIAKAKSTGVRPSVPLMEWQFIAARDGAMSVFHFGKIFEAVNSCLGRCPTLLGMVNRPILKSARKLLRETFPNVETVRHAVAHSAELMKDRDSMEANALKGPYNAGGFLIGENATVVMRNVLNQLRVPPALPGWQ